MLTTKSSESLIAILLAMGVFFCSVPPSYAKTLDNFYLSPKNVVPRGSAEYFPANDKAKLLYPVRVWGEVTQPGIHYVAEGTTLIDVISAAGGPTNHASLSSVKLIRGGGEKVYDIGDGEGLDVLVQQKDTVHVDYSMKKDLPLLFGGISAIVSVLTLYLVAQDRRD